MRIELPATVALLVMILFSVGLYLALWLKRVNVVRKSVFWAYEIVLWTVVIQVVAAARVSLGIGLMVWRPWILIYLAPGVVVGLAYAIYVRFEATATFYLYNARGEDVEELNRIVARHIVSRTGPWVLQPEKSRPVLVLGKAEAKKDRAIQAELDAYLREHGRRSPSVWVGLAVWGLLAVGCVAVLVAGSPVG